MKSSFIPLFLFHFPLSGVKLVTDINRTEWKPVKSLLLSIGCKGDISHNIMFYCFVAFHLLNFPLILRCTPQEKQNNEKIFLNNI